jgi:putative hydrolase of the HAD superfamily
LIADKALVLDFGGVVTRTLFETHALTERALGLAPGTLSWRGPFELESDPLWCAMQNDEIPEREYWATRTREVSELCGENWTSMSDFVKAARGRAPAEVIRPEALNAINIARKKACKLAILSNELDLFYGADFREKLPFMEWFDVIIDATYTEILKPDPRAYQACIDALGIDAARCVFVDDQYRNIVGAMNAGMQAVHFDVQQPQKSYQQALNLLSME